MKPPLCLMLPLVLAACGKPVGGAQDSAKPVSRPSDTASASNPTPAAPSAPDAATPGILSCSADIGASAAARRVAVCRNVSPATHPPCNATNSCAMIEDEIARSCALLDGKGAPMDGCTPVPTSAEAAAAVVRRYYQAINAHDYDTAWAQWGDGGQPGTTRAAFEAGFADTRSVRVVIGRLEPGDGGAGSIYQPVPVTVDATTAAGARQRFRGSYVVRRVNGVDGATPAQLRWHLDSARLAPASLP